MPKPPISAVTPAQRAWSLMFDFLIRTAPQRNAALSRRGLTPNDSRALTSLDATEGRTMRSLAEAWNCDASNATWIVDRMEHLGLAERRGSPSDRRVKLVVLTERGAELKQELFREFYTPPAELLALDHDTLAALLHALERLSALPADAQATSESTR